MKEYSSSLREHLLQDELFGDNCSENVNGGGNCALCRMGPQPWNWLIYSTRSPQSCVQGGEGGMRS